MAESCPLDSLDLVELAEKPDSEGWVWEPRIPEECLGCLSGVDENCKTSIVHEVVDDRTGKPYSEDHDRYFIRGISATEDGSRMGIEESGIDDGTGYDGPKEVETIFTFECTRV